MADNKGKLPEMDGAKIQALYDKLKRPDQLSDKNIADKSDTDAIRKVAKLFYGPSFNEKFYVIGGTAIQMYGGDRPTHDIDMIFDTTGDNKAALQNFKDAIDAYSYNAETGGFVKYGAENIIFWYDNLANPQKTLSLDLHIPSDFLTPIVQQTAGINMDEYERTGAGKLLIDDGAEKLKAELVTGSNTGIKMLTIPASLLRNFRDVIVAPPTLILCYKLISILGRSAPFNVKNDLRDIDWLATSATVDFDFDLDKRTIGTKRPKWTIANLLASGSIPIADYKDGVVVWEAARRTWHTPISFWHESFVPKNAPIPRAVSFREKYPKIDWLPPPSPVVPAVAPAPARK